MKGRTRASSGPSRNRLRGWAAELSSAAEGSPLAADLASAILTILLWDRSRPGQRRGARLGVRDLSAVRPGVESLDGDLAPILDLRFRRGGSEDLDRAIANVDEKIRDFGELPPAEDLLGAAHEAVLGACGAHGRMRRLSGVYYTPREVVDYIVNRTVARTRGSEPAILDPACGAGPFLTGAFRRLRARDRSPRGSWKAVSGLYGVDTDRRAVSIARLLLREGARGSGRVSPRLDETLDAHLVAGSALGGAGGDPGSPSAIDAHFSSVLDAGGFDVVLGNPPYVQNRALASAEKLVWRSLYRSARGQFDLLVLFVEKGMDVLRPGGRLGYLVSNKFMTASYGRELRERILETCAIEEIVDLSRVRVFRGAAVYPSILVLRKHPGRVPAGSRVKLRHGVTDLRYPGKAVAVPQSLFENRPGKRLTTAIGGAGAALVARVERESLPLGERARVGCGLAYAGMGRSLLEEHELPRSGSHEILPFVRVENLGPYRVAWSGQWVALDPRRVSERKLSDFRSPKVLVPGIRRTLEAAYDATGYALGRVYYLRDTQDDPRFLLALLNSPVLDAYYRTVFGPVVMGSGYLRFNGPYLESLPVPRVSPGDPRVRALLRLVSRRLELGVGPRGAAAVERADSQIHAKVTELYGLTLREVQRVAGEGRRARGAWAP